MTNDTGRRVESTRFEGNGRSLCVVVSVSPAAPEYRIALTLVEAALERGLLVWIYLLDEAVQGLVQGGWERVTRMGGRLLACGVGLRRHEIHVMDETVNPVGLSMLGEIMAKADRTIGFHVNE